MSNLSHINYDPNKCTVIINLIYIHNYLNSPTIANVLYVCFIGVVCNLVGQYGGDPHVACWSSCDVEPSARVIRCCYTTNTSPPPQCHLWLYVSVSHSVTNNQLSVLHNNLTVPHYHPSVPHYHPSVPPPQNHRAMCVNTPLEGEGEFY